ncbi:MAG: GDP-mannose 4,6-dehydratase [Acidobacteriota bacterium]|nr:GDP-mannose 4,6-dehydratase [Acidobacteriota bacterium]
MEHGLAMRFLITGISGFVGCHLARHLVDSGAEVVGTCLGACPELPGVKVYDADLLDPSELARVVEEANPEVVVHLGGRSHVGESWKKMAEHFQVNVLGTENLLKAAAGRRVVLASSAEVYGRVPEAQQPIGEEQPLAPRTPYALTKAAAERLALGAGAVVVRSFNVVGPGQAPQFALPAFTAQLAAIEAGRQEPVLKVGNLGARRDFVHIADAVRGYRLAAERGESGGVYNLATGVDHSVREVLEKLIQVSGLKVDVEQDSRRVRPVDVALLRGDSRRLEALGWSVEFDLDRALEDLWAARTLPVLEVPP